MKSSLKTLLCAAALAAALAGCGGAQRGERFAAARVLAFGDETSVIDGAGRKYTINALDAAGGFDCSANPIWVQAVASAFNRPFAECAGTNASAPSRILAVPGARVADLQRQIDDFQAGQGAVGDRDLATVLVGQHDLLDLYARYDGTNGDALVAQAEVLGPRVTEQVVRLSDLGAKVLLATVPDLGLTPFGRNEGPERAALLSRMTREFNIQTLVSLPNDGHRFGLVRSDDLVRNLVSANRTAGFTNVTDAACLAPLPECTTATLNIDNNGLVASPSAWLWADAFQLSPGGHQRLGEAAVTRATNNPF